MPPKKVKKPSEVKVEANQSLFPEEKLKVEATLTKPKAAAPEDFIASLNQAVSNVNSLFQLRDSLMQEINELKAEVQLGEQMKIEQGKLEDLKRQRETFEYEFSVQKNRLNQELEETELNKKQRLFQLEEEHKEKLKSQADAQALKLKLEREDHERRLKLEREDFERKTAQFAVDKKELDAKTAAFEAERGRLRESLVQELNRDNAHQLEITKLQHQKEVELIRGEFKLEQASRLKFEKLLQEAQAQNEKLAAQLIELSREALASAGHASVAGKLRELVGQLTSQNAPARGS